MSPHVNRRWLLACVAAVGIIGAPLSAGADKPSILFLGIANEQLTLDKRVTQLVRQQLEARSFPVLWSKDLRPSDYLTRDPELLAQIGRMYKVSWILAGEVRPMGNVTMNKYAMLGLLLNVKTSSPLYVEGRCDDCGSATARADHMTFFLSGLLAKRGILPKKASIWAPSLVPSLVLASGAAVLAAGLGAAFWPEQSPASKGVAGGGIELGATGVLVGSAWLYRLLHG